MYDPHMNQAELLQVLSNLRSRGEIKRCARFLESHLRLRRLLIEILDERGTTLTGQESTKKLLRLWLKRSEASQVRKNPIHVDEAFICAYCHASVPKGGIMIRDHCPFCLCSQHLDVVPGDRSANCGGKLVPTDLENTSDQWWIVYSCSICDHKHRVRAHPDDQLERFSRQ